MKIPPAMRRYINAAILTLCDCGELEVYLVKRDGEFRLAWGGRPDELVGSYTFNRRTQRRAEARPPIERDVREALRLRSPIPYAVTKAGRAEVSMRSAA